MRIAHPSATQSPGIFALSTYLGHARVADTYWYLEATPVLLREVAEAGEILLQGVPA